MCWLTQLTSISIRIWTQVSQTSTSTPFCHFHATFSFIQCALGIHSGCTNGVQGWVCSEQRPSATWAGSMEFNFAALTGICGIMVFIHGLSPMTCLLVVPGDIWSACQVLNSLPPKAMCSYPYFYESYHHPPSQLELCFSFSLFQL
jgi:hypothetical protein